LFEQGQLETGAVALKKWLMPFSRSFSVLAVVVVCQDLNDHAARASLDLDRMPRKRNTFYWLR
jgi:hypothetical protein